MKRRSSASASNGNGPARRTLAIASLAVLGAAANAAQLKVPADFPVIQAAIVAAANGDEILVSPGTYYENLDFLDKNVSVVSVAGPSTTIIDGRSLTVVVQIESPSRRPSLLKGFTIQHGFVDSTSATRGGGGILIWGGSPTIEDNIIIDNAGCFGAGIYIDSAAAHVLRNRIAGNHPANCGEGGGGGIYAEAGANVHIVDNVIEGNSAAGDEIGGGIGMFSPGPRSVISGNIIAGNTAGFGGQGGGFGSLNQDSIQFTNNLVVRNDARSGGGVFLSIPSGVTGVEVLNNTIADNQADSDGSDVWLDGFAAGVDIANNVISTSSGSTGLFCDPSYSKVPPALSFNDVYGSNGAGVGGTCSGALSSNGNIALDPQFRRAGRTAYQPRPSSPLVDAGDNTHASGLNSDLAHRPRIVDGNRDGAAVVDIGAFEVPAPAGRAAR